MGRASVFPSDAERAFVAETQRAQIASLTDLSREHGVGRVARLELDDARVVILKRSGTVEKHRREVAAYRTIAAQGTTAAPRLLAESAELPALLLTAEAGRADLPLADDASEAVHEAAGRWLAGLHRSPRMGADPMPLREAYARRAERWLAQARGLVPDAQWHAAESHVLSGLPALAHLPRVPCHRDYSRRNWLVDRGRLVAVVDFEHARDDVAEVDLVILAARNGPEAGPAWRAFLRGYRSAGGPADPEAPHAPLLVVLEALGTIVWADRHGDAPFGEAGRRALERALVTPPTGL